MTDEIQRLRDRCLAIAVALQYNLPRLRCEYSPEDDKTERFFASVVDMPHLKDPKKSRVAFGATELDALRALEKWLIEGVDIYCKCPDEGMRAKLREHEARAKVMRELLGEGDDADN